MQINVLLLIYLSNAPRELHSHFTLAESWPPKWLHLACTDVPLAINQQKSKWVLN